MSMLKFIRRELRSSESSSLLSEDNIEVVKKGVTKALNTALNYKFQKRGKYNSYTPEQQATISKYAEENGPSHAAKHYITVWGVHINESTARRLKTEYLEMRLRMRFQRKKTGMVKILLLQRLLLSQVLKLKEVGCCSWEKTGCGCTRDCK